ncbi:efflux RND transporter periplasmic adaptor subunit [Desulfogranum marinum]|uniref:efflux RND transporter periplasmic adaptor subunit n=1 Tax=Desulfogranum marinum TaxID=453220 RepID=UPI00196582C1|nr:efflux RND transporter periplasmic adaptor subunit [Desulfogranum marinum]MBM9511681.1 efflux RND transporter periplasmic adaptor subunit [Desulfogranum marinum]
MKTKTILRIFTVAITLVATLQPSFVAKAAEQAQQQTPRAVPVSAITLKTTTIQLKQHLPGRSVAYKVAEIRPQVTGIITERLFTEGSMVEQGQQLYQINPAPYQAVYNKVKADLLRAEANLASVAAKEARYRESLKVSVVSEQDYDDAKAALLDAKASVAIAKAAIESAEIDLNYTKVYSPISGQIGKSTFTEGALVTANQSTLLAKVTQLDPIYVDMQESRKKVLSLREKSKNTDKVMVTLDLGDGFTYEHQGQFQFSEVTVNPTTSSVELRAIFPNPDQILFPGLFVRATLLLDTVDALLIPQKAGIIGPGGQMNAWIIDDKDTAQLVPIVAKEIHENNWIVTKGLKIGDTVITEGFQKLRPNAPVVVTPAAEDKK